MCLNIGTHKTVNFPFETNGKLMVLGVPILKNFRVSRMLREETKENYRISVVIRQGFFRLPKQSKKSRPILKDGARSLRLPRKGKIRVVAKFHKTALISVSHSRERKPCQIKSVVSAL